MSIMDDIRKYQAEMTLWGNRKDLLLEAADAVADQKKKLDKIAHSGEIDLDDLKWKGQTADEFRDKVFTESLEEMKRAGRAIDKVHDGLRDEAREASSKSSWFGGLLSEVKRALPPDAAGKRW